MSHDRIDHETLPDGLGKLRTNVEITAMEESWEEYGLEFTREVLESGTIQLQQGKNDDSAP